MLIEMALQELNKRKICSFMEPCGTNNILERRRGRREKEVDKSIDKMDSRMHTSCCCPRLLGNDNSKKKEKEKKREV